MTGHPRSRRHLAAWTSLLVLSPLAALAAPAVAAPASPHATLAGAAEAAAETASASEFLFYMYPLSPLGEQACTGVGANVSERPWFASDDCGFASFSLTGNATKVEVKLYVDDETTPFATIPATGSDGDYRVSLEPTEEWKSGVVRMVVLADGAVAGEAGFGHNLLRATIDQLDPIAPGEELEVTGTLEQLNSAAHSSENTGVPGAFTLRVTRPDGEVVHSTRLRAASDGSFAALVPEAATADVESGPDRNFTTVLGVKALNADYTDDSTGAWKAREAGVGTAKVINAPNSLQLHNSFVSSVGWVKPGDTYPSRVTVTNATDRDWSGVSVRVPSPDGTTFTQARAGASAGTATVSGGDVTWTLGTVPKAAADGTPTARTLVLEAEADTLVEDPELVWKNLSSTATLLLDGEPADLTSESRGPRVIPQSAKFDTARYGDRPFPVVPVDYRDRKHQPSNSGDELSDVINSPEVPGSTFNLFQEISLGQLFPHGTVPSAGIATSDFTYEPGFDFTSAEPQGTCTGVTTGSDAAGTPLHPNRVEDGFYQLPGDTAYYGGDRFGSALVGAVAGVGALMDIDSACGPTGKLVYDSAAIADPEIDYSDYDTDKDGVVDFFMVVFAGCGGHGASQLSVVGCDYADAPYDNVWPHSSSLEFYYTDEATGLTGYISDDQLENLEGQKMYYTDDTYSAMTTAETEYPVFVRVGPYNVNPETSIDKASVISHEYGHSLGLPDFYSLGSRDTYGDWNLMASDKSQNMDVYSRQEMGWVVPQVLEPGQRTTVEGWADSKKDTHEITWERPDGTPYTLRGPGVHNAEAYVAKLPGRQLIDPAKFDSGDKASQTHAWWSGSGNDFGCPPQGGHNLDIALPGATDLPAGSTVELTFKSLWDIEWDYDYGFVLTSGDNGKTYSSHESKNGYTTPGSSNPNQNACQGEFGNGLTGTSGSYDAGTEQTDRLLGDYPESVFKADAYDVSDLVGKDQPVLRFSYATDPGLARPGWFIDDIAVVATKPDGSKVDLLRTDLETSGDPEDPQFFSGGCKGLPGQSLTTATRCTQGWNYVDSSSEAPSDHAYYLELRDRSGFDYDGKGQNDRDPIAFQPGLSLVYTDEAHGYGNVGTDNPPAQSPLDANPEPGSDTPELADAAFTFDGTKRFSDSGDGHVDNYSDPSEEKPAGDVEDPWRFDFGCLTFDITRMAGDDLDAPPADGDLNADVVFDLGAGCGEYDYGYVEEPPAPNSAPVAKATARPQPVIAGKPVTLSGNGSTDAETPRDLQYSWDFDITRDTNGDEKSGNDKDAVGKNVSTTYRDPGTYTARLTVTDPRGATDSTTVDVVVAEAASQPSRNTAPNAKATAKPRFIFKGRKVTLSGSRSTDAETPNRLRYRWHFGDRSEDRGGETLTKRYNRPGVYDAELTVTDPQGGRDRDRVQVHVLRRVTCQQQMVKWTGSWRSRRGSSSATGGTYCDNLGATTGKDALILGFTGPRLTLNYGIARRGGRAVVFIDGKRSGVVSFDGRGKAPRFVRSLTWDGLGRTRHTLRLVMKRGAGYVDDFVIAGVPRRP
ncbi:MAG TPA: PKD domain-containing protein [Nocardioidaceae bacterium]|nr:PKD domain-containing protein [Nocardioidaceae bacterium]